MRAFSQAIDVRNTKKYHAEMSFHAALRGAKIKSLDEILGVSSELAEFDEKTDALLEAKAQELLAKRKAEHGGPTPRN